MATAAHADALSEVEKGVGGGESGVAQEKRNQMGRTATTAATTQGMTRGGGHGGDANCAASAAVQQSHTPQLRPVKKLANRCINKINDDGSGQARTEDSKGITEKDENEVGSSSFDSANARAGDEHQSDEDGGDEDEGDRYFSAPSPANSVFSGVSDDEALAAEAMVSF